MREELGDVLLQVLFHARVAREQRARGAERSFDIDDVAADLVAKLVGRHPHVFAGTRAGRHRASARSTAGRSSSGPRSSATSSVDGVPLGQPAVALAAKLISRTARAGLPADLLPGGAGVGERLFADAARAKLAGEDPEAALRTAARRFADDVRAAERSARGRGPGPARARRRRLARPLAELTYRDRPAHRRQTRLRLPSTNLL